MVHRFYDEFDIIPHYIKNPDELKTHLETVLLINLGRVHYDYSVNILDGSRDLACKVVQPKCKLMAYSNVTVGYGDTLLECLYELCIKFKDELYHEVRSVFNERYLRETEQHRERKNGYWCDFS